MKKWSILLLTLAVCLAVAQEADLSLMKIGYNQAKLSIPEISGGIEVDGNIDKEWKVFSECNGFVSNKRLLLPDKEGKVRFCRDKEFLYIAVVTSTPSTDPGGALLSNVRTHDGAVYEDDSVEFYLHNGKTGFILIANALGAVYDATFTAPKNKNVKWNFKGAKLASRVESGWWVLEVAIPLAELGNPRTLSLNVIRNWTGLGPSMLNYTSNYLDVKSMFQADLAPGAASVREVEMGNPAGGEWEYSALVHNPTSTGLECAVLLGHHAKGGPTVDAFEKRLIQPGQSGEVRFNATITTGNIRILTLVLRNPADGRIYHARRLMVQKGLSLGRRPATGTFSIPKIGSGQFYLLPGYGKVAVECRANGSGSLKSMSMQVSGQKPVPFTLKNGKWHASSPIPEKAGTYPVSLEWCKKDNSTQKMDNAFSLKIRHFEWKNNSIGKEQIILPPFTPMTLEENLVGNLTSVRAINGLGLYDSLNVDGRELLAAPMSLAMTVNGKPTPVHSGKASLKNDNGYAVEALAVATTDAGVTLETKGTLEYDGFHWISLALKSEKCCTVERLTLSIPLKNAEVPLFHAVANELRTNPAGNLPAGEGMLWGGSKLPRKKHAGEEMLHPQVVPYLWLGAESRGLSWFMDSSFGYKLDRNADAVRILRKGSVVTVEIDLINKPVTLSGTRRMEFGFHPTPVKPLPAGVKQTFYDSEGRELPGMFKAQFFLLDFACNFPARWSKRPMNGDYSALNELTQALSDGKKLELPPYLSRLSQIHQRDLTILKKYPTGEEVYAKRPRQNASFLKMYTANKARGKSLPFAYVDHRLEFMGNPDADYFKSEWWNPAAQNYFAAWRTTLTPSNLDYLVFCLDRLAAEGLHGFFLDDAYLMPDTNPDTVARIDSEGELHSEIGILSLRQLLNRLAVVLHKRNKYPMVLNVHMTDGLLVPCFAKVTAQTGFEMKYGEDPIPMRFSPDYVRTVGVGDKLGANSLLLSGIKRKATPQDKWPETERKLKRSVWTTLLLHNLRHTFSQTPDIYQMYQRLVSFGVGREDCLFVPYWEDGDSLKAEGMLISTYRYRGKILAVIANYYSPDEKVVKLKVDFQRLGLAKNCTFSDLEDGSTIDPNALRVGGYDFRLVQLTP